MFTRNPSTPASQAANATRPSGSGVTSVVIEPKLAYGGDWLGAAGLGKYSRPSVTSPVNVLIHPSTTAATRPLAVAANSRSPPPPKGTTPAEVTALVTGLYSFTRNPLTPACQEANASRPSGRGVTSVVIEPNLRYGGDWLGAAGLRTYSRPSVTSPVNVLIHPSTRAATRPSAVACSSRSPPPPKGTIPAEVTGDCGGSAFGP